MGDLLSKVIPLSLGAAISPTVLGLTLVILAGKRSIARGTAFLFGVLVVLGGLTALGLVGVRHGPPSATQVEITRGIDGVAGALLLLLALTTILKTYLRDPSSPTEDSRASADRNPGLVSAFVLGLVVMVSNFSTILLYLPDMRVINDAQVSTSSKVIAIVIAFAITSLPATAPYSFRLCAPKASGRVFAGLHRFIARHERTIGVVVEVIFGVYLVIKAIK
jgi:hypothetical protein